MQAQEQLLQLGQQIDLQHRRQAQDYLQQLGQQINEQVAVDLRNQLNSVRSHPLAQASRGGGAGEGRMADSDSDDISDTAEALVFWGDGPPEGVLLREPLPPLAAGPPAEAAAAAFAGETRDEMAQETQHVEGTPGGSLGEDSDHEREAMMRDLATLEAEHAADARVEREEVLGEDGIEDGRDLASVDYKLSRVDWLLVSRALFLRLQLRSLLWERVRAFI